MTIVRIFGERLKIAIYSLIFKTRMKIFKTVLDLMKCTECPVNLKELNSTLLAY